MCVCVCACVCPDGCITARAPRPEVTDKQLLQVARRLGKEWRQVGIFLGLRSRHLDELQAGEKDVTMQKFKMLEEWRRQQGQQGHASLQKLKSSLEELDDLPPEVLLILQGGTHTHKHTQTHSYTLTQTYTDTHTYTHADTLTQKIQTGH